MNTLKHCLNTSGHLQTLAEIKNAVPYPDEDFLEAGYMAIWSSKQFTKACEIQKRKPAPNRATKAQFRTFFQEKYEIYDAGRDLLHDIGVANNAVMQEKLDQQQAQMEVLTEKFVA